MSEAAQKRKRPNVLVLAGLDPSGGAGLWADGGAIAAAGGRPLLCATAITVQSTARVHSYHPVPAGVIEAQVLALLEDEEEAIAAVKVGMIGSAAAMAAIERLMDHPSLAAAPWVIDPVLRASSGAALVEGGAGAYEAVLRRAEVVTPNVDEAAALGLHLAGRGGASSGPGRGGAPESDEAFVSLARRILDLGVRAVLLKGGHLEGAPVDRLLTPSGMERLEGVRIPGSRRGTGCRLASFLAARLAAGDRLLDAARSAKAHVATYLEGREG